MLSGRMPPHTEYCILKDTHRLSQIHGVISPPSIIALREHCSRIRMPGGTATTVRGPPTNDMECRLSCENLRRWHMQIAAERDATVQRCVTFVHFVVKSRCGCHCGRTEH